MPADTLPIWPAAQDTGEVPSHPESSNSLALKPKVIPIPGPSEPFAVGRKQGARLFSVSLATWDRWDSSGLLGPVGTKKAGRKLWLLSELREWGEAGMPCRKEWLGMKAVKATGGPRR